MKKEDLFEAIGDLDEKDIRMAEKYRVKRSVWKWGIVFACAALIIAVIVNSPGLKETSDIPDVPQPVPHDLKTVNAVIPQAQYADMSASEFMNTDAHWEWWNGYREKTAVSGEYRDAMDPYYAAMMEKLLVAEEDNTVCSPLNIYIALSALAETAGGNSRDQILDLLEADSIDVLRERIQGLLAANYVDTPVLQSWLADSLWLRDYTEYNEETIGRLADLYMASVFRGDPGSEEMSEALRKWTDLNTGGLLKQYTKDLQLESRTILAIISTVYFKAMWMNTFDPSLTDRQIFHGVSGDTETDMMHMSDMTAVYRTDRFTAVQLGLTDSGSMTLFLPEGTDVNELAEDPDVLAASRSGLSEKVSYPMVHMSVPKFRVSAKYDLLDVLDSLGVTDILDPATADFTPLTTDADNPSLSKAEHAAMTEIDENGVTGAAYTELMITESAAEPQEEIDFNLDRPFMFIVTAADGSVLFAGIVRNIA